MVMDFDLTGVHGYVIAQKDFSIDLTPDYQFTFDMRAEAPVNNFEFKLLDSLENVYWVKKLNIEYPENWKHTRIKKRQINFAWGPSGDVGLVRVKKVEFVVSVGSGGKGKVWIDNFRFEPILPEPGVRPPVVTVSSGTKPSVNSNAMTGWKTVRSNQTEWVSVDFNRMKEIGGLILDWDDRDYATAYDVLVSDDGKDWWTAYSVTAGNGKRDYICTPETEGRRLKLQMNKSSRGKGYVLKKVQFKGAEFSASMNGFFTSIASESRKGLYPKYFLNRQSYWTIVGASGDEKEALINEEGQIEVDKSSFSLEPFLYVDDALITWSDGLVSQSLLENVLPIPSVTWNYRNELFLTVQAVSGGPAGKSMLSVKYSVESRKTRKPGRFFVAMCPFQVNPPWQTLNTEGGAARIDSIGFENGVVRVNTQAVIPMSKPAAFGAAEFDAGHITDYIARGSVPPSRSPKCRDHFGYASAALQYTVSLESGSVTNFYLAVPFHGWNGSPAPGMHEGEDGIYYDLMLGSTVADWRSALGKVQIILPPFAQKVSDVLKTTLAYILINKDGPGIQPGSRSYERSWIRDGSLTATALLQTGHSREAREFIDWYSQFQFPDGKIPCVVDARGADPTPENDSHGEFLYALMQYFRFTGDTTWLRGQWDRAAKTVKYIQFLRAQRKTAPYKEGTPLQRACYGLLPESISHEGYSAKPMHSYWDDFFALRGLKDAAMMAGVLGKTEQEKEFRAEAEDFSTDLYASIRLAMQTGKIDYIPGCAELADFDATSTSIGVVPCGELGNIPEPQLHNTFDKYFSYFTARKNNAASWVNYTPYEVRTIGTFITLDQKKRAHELLNYFLKDQRPPAWNHWAEVVWKNSSTPKFIGDMPHTWVGSDFIRSVRSMFVYERDRDSALVVGAGIAGEWLDDPRGIAVKDLPTYYGALNYSMKKTGNHVSIAMEGNLRIPKGGIILKSPLEKPVTSAAVNGKAVIADKAGEIIIGAVPAKIELSYR